MRALRRKTDKKASKRQVGAYSARIATVGFLFVAFLALCVFKLVQLQLVDSEQLARKASEWQYGTVRFFAKRGKIFDRSGNVLALTVETKGIQIHTPSVKYPEDVIDYVSGLLAWDRETARRKALCGSTWCYVHRFMDHKYAASLERVLNYEGEDAQVLWLKEHLAGVQVVKAAARLYPFKQLAGQVVGLASVPHKAPKGRRYPDPMKLEGHYGIEAALETTLTGRPVSQRGLKRTKQGLSLLPENPDLILEGNGVILSLDVNIQEIAEQELERAVITSMARRGVALVQDVRTGELLAVAHFPPFNPNNSSGYKSSEWWKWVDSAFSQMQEPGSTLKPLFVAMALEEGLVTLDSSVFCENGLWKVDPRERPIRDHEPFGFLTVADIIKYSSNIGVGKLGLKVGKKKVHKYLKAFGFGKRTGVKPSNESGGLLSNGGKWCDLELANVSFGQGIATTAVQLISAISALGNRGRLMRPLLIKEILDGAGNTIVRYTPECVSTPVSAQTAAHVLSAMERVAEPGGTGEKAVVYGFTVAGKTGTAQKVLTVQDPYWEPSEEDPSPDRVTRYVDKWIASFVGLIPANEPRLAILVMVDEPYMSHYGGVVSAPAFSRIASRAMTYLNIAPDYERRHRALAQSARPAAEVHQEEPQPITPRGVGPVGVPDFAGMTVAECLRAAMDSRVTLNASGSGLAVKQSPAPETVVEEWSQVKVSFEHGYVAKAEVQ